MSDIGNIQGPGGPGQVRPVSRSPYVFSPEPEPPLTQRDTVQISVIAEMLGKIRDLPDVRVGKVAPVRQAIQSGTYDVRARLDVAIERLLKDL